MGASLQLDVMDLNITMSTSLAKEILRCCKLHEPATYQRVSSVLQPALNNSKALEEIRASSKAYN